MPRYSVLLVLVPAALIAAGGIASAHDKLHEAIERLEERRAEAPADADLLLRLADLHRLHGDYGKALECTAPVGIEERPVVLLHRARIHHDAGRDSEAQRELDEFLSREPACAEGWFFKAELLAASGKDRDSAAACTKALAASPESATADHFMRCAELWTLAGEPGTARETIAQGQARHSRHIGLAEEGARLSFAAGKRKEGIEQLARLRSLHPAMAYRWWAMEGDLLRASDPGKARAAYEQALTALDRRYRTGPMPDPVAAIRLDLGKKRTALADGGPEPAAPLPGS